MLPRSYILRDNGQVEPCDNMVTHAAWLKDPHNRIVESVAVPFGDMTEAVLITTIFLGWDLSYGEGDPELFETFVEKPGEKKTIHSRYATLVEAQAGHAGIVEEVTRSVKHEKVPDPDCPDCYGNGEVINGFGMEVRCECTL